MNTRDVIAEELTHELRDRGHNAQTGDLPGINWVHVPISNGYLQININTNEIWLIGITDYRSNESATPLGSWDLADPDWVDKLWPLLELHL